MYPTLHCSRTNLGFIMGEL